MWSLDHADGWSSNVNSARNLQRWLMQGKKGSLLSVSMPKPLSSKDIWFKAMFTTLLHLVNRIFWNFVLIMLAFHCWNSTLEIQNSCYVKNMKNISFCKYFILELIIIWRNWNSSENDKFCIKFCLFNFANSSS